MQYILNCYGNELTKGCRN